ncbi:hypothetical protein HNR46_003748 [Haloferula luteola]|uniref:Alpha-glucosidase n=1 Tax=Haloferula luteola TaxID=595692 RepID=A0A840V5G8_9BACT|nr:glycoside hydrolase family 97 catalytic domain-containing protein [Haloferula luteola]MBB5353487.1 hypothetical protein [Haloferula luteola]
MRSRAFGWFGVFVLSAHAGDRAELVSPDGKNTLALIRAVDGAWSYEIKRSGKSVLLPSPLGLKSDAGDFTHDLRWISESQVERRRESYKLPWGPPVDQAHRRKQVILENPEGSRLAWEMDVSNQGVAFRYRILGRGSATLEDERTGFVLPSEAKGWMSPYNRSAAESPAYEDYYFPVVPGQMPPFSRGGETRGWYFPALWNTGDSWLLMAEVGGDWGSHFAATSVDGSYQLEFPFADETTQGIDLGKEVRPSGQLPWALPWRVFVLGDRAGDLATSSFVTDLAEPSQVSDGRWIRPGRAFWDWWSHPEAATKSVRTRRCLGGVEFAHEMGWEYAVLDAGWWEADLDGIRRAAQKADIRLIGWTHANDFYDEHRRNRKLDELKALGFSGVKIDFWCSDRQPTHEAMLATLKATAERQLVVSFHGCTIPRGWQRTWPHLLTAEAVLGTESYMFDDRYPEKSAQLHTLLPFTRNVMAPMDQTPFGLASKRYRRLNSAAHELAAAVVFQTGLLSYADSPDRYRILPPEVLEVMRDLPVEWEEIRWLGAEPGELVVVAKRAGKTWWIGAMNGSTTSREVALNLAELSPNGEGMGVFEGPEPLDSFHIQKLERGSRSWNRTIPPRGGWLLRWGEAP